MKLSGTTWKLLAGLVLVLLGLLWLLNNIGVMYFDFGDFMARAWPVAIIIVGVWLLMGGRRERVVISNGAADHVSHGLGDVDYAPTHIGPNGLALRVSAGEVRLDLTKAALEPRESRVAVKIGFGDVRVLVPKDVAVRIDGRTGIGDLHLLDRHADGFGANLDYEDANYSAATKRLYIEAKAGLGDVKVTRG